MRLNTEFKDDNIEGLGNDVLMATAPLKFAYVKELIDDKLVLEGDNFRLKAMKAPSCLISPKIGDYVAAISDATDVFVVAVLRRSNNETALKFESEEEIAISAPSIRLLGSKSLSLSGRQGFLTCSNFNFFSSKIDITADVADTKIGRLSHFGKSLKIALGDFLIRAATSMRIIEDIDFHRAKETSIKADKFLSLQGEMTCITAKTDVKVDAERIHMG